MKHQLSKETLADLKRSGLDARDAQRMRITEHADNWGKQQQRSYRIAYFGLDGKPKAFYRTRFLEPLRKSKDGEPIRYDQQKGSEPHAYFAPLLRRPWRVVAKDSKIEIYITEGEKKAAAACKAGLSCIGLGGVWSWKSKKKGIDFLPELEEINWTERRVTIVFDSDASENGHVRRAELWLAQQLRSRGAIVDVVRLPSDKNSEKVGLDDYLVKSGRAKFDKLPREQPIASGMLILDRGDPLASARAFVESHSRDDNGARMLLFNGDVYEWRGSHYAPVPYDVLRSRLYKFLETAKVATENGVEPFRPNRSRVGDVLDALRGETELHTVTGIKADEYRPSTFWLDDQKVRPAAEDLLPCANGLLDLNTLRVLPHTPALFNTLALPFDYDPKAPKPKRWRAFLRELWPNDPESIATLQEMFGLFLASDTRHQKIFLIVGPKRAGKGAIVRVLHDLLGKRNVAAPTLDSLTRNFGLAPLIGKSLATVSDARLGDRSDQKVVAERLLSISGEDSLTIDRKHKSAWTGRLSVRFLLTTNEVPRIADASGALASRFIVLRLTHSFFGREDLELDRKLRAELPGVLNWSLDGLRRLRRRGYFTQPKSALESIRLLEDLTSPMSAFLRDRVKIGAAYSVSVDRLFTEWQDWGKKNGREHTGTAQSFGRDLHAALPELRTGRSQVKGKRENVYLGIGLIDDRAIVRK